MQTQTFHFPLLGILGILFIALKLTGYIAWSWWWVLLPFWASLAIVGVFLLVLAIVAAVA